MADLNLSEKEKAKFFDSLIEQNTISLDLAYRSDDRDLLQYILKKKLKNKKLYTSDTELIRVYRAVVIDDELLNLTTEYFETTNDAVTSLLIRSDAFTKDFYIEHFERFSNYYKLIKMYKTWALDSDIVLLNTLNNSEDDYFNKIQIIDNAGTWEVDSKKFKSCFRHELRNIEKYINYYNWSYIFGSKPMKPEQVKMVSRHLKEIYIGIGDFLNFITKYKDVFNEDEVIEMINGLLSTSSSNLGQAGYSYETTTYNSIEVSADYKGYLSLLNCYQEDLPKRFKDTFHSNHKYYEGYTFPIAVPASVPTAIALILAVVPSVKNPEERSEKFKKFLDDIPNRDMRYSANTGTHIEGFLKFHGNTTVKQLTRKVENDDNLMYYNRNICYLLDKDTVPMKEWIKK